MTAGDGKGDESARLQRIRAATREPDGRPDDHVRRSHRRVGVTHALPPLCDHVRAHLRVQHRRVRRQRRFDVDQAGSGS